MGNKSDNDVDDILDTKPNKNKASPAPKAGLKAAKAAVKKPSKPVITKPAAKKAAKKAKSGGINWTRPDDFDDIVKKVHTALKRQSDFITAGDMASKLELDTNHVRWAFKKLAKDKLVKIRLNKNNRVEAKA